jgi:ubiquinol-cytochrome c reductase cytochrome b subunit
MFKYAINPQITNARNKTVGPFKFRLVHIYMCLGKLSMLVGISEAICVLFNIYSPCLFNFFPYTLCSIPLIQIATKKDKKNPEKFNEWLAGLIDGDGSFLLSKKGYASLEITKDLRDKKALFLIKQKYGGSVKLRSGSKSKRYRLHSREG